MSHSITKPFSIILVIILGIFSIYNSLNFKLDASSDTLILQNDEDFKYFNYYNEIFPNKNFLVLAVKSNKIIDQQFINYIKKIKTSLTKIENLEHEGDRIVHSIYTLLDKSFITPIDREDISRLTILYDNVLDAIWDVTNRMNLMDMGS